MSIAAMNWAWELPLPPEPKFTMVALADRADEDGLCWPSVSWLVKKTGYSERAVRAHLAKFREDGLLEVKKRARDDGGQSSNEYRLALRQPGLPLDTPPAANAGGGAVASSPPAGKGEGPLQQVQGPPAVTAPHDPSLDPSEERKAGAGGAPPRPVAACFTAYQAGIRKRYGAEYPPSRQANGMLAHVVTKLGAEPALRVVEFYLAHEKAFYVQRKHALEILVKDCSTLWLELQSVTGAGAGAAPSKAAALVEFEDGRVKHMNDYPVAEPLDIARACVREYSGRIAQWRVRNIVVRIGGRQTKFTPQEAR